MQIQRGRALGAVAVAMHVSPFQRGCCSAFTTRRHPNSIPKAAFSSKSGSGTNPIHRTQPVKSNVRLNVSSSLSPEECTFFSIQEVERELQAALECARDMDKKHGLCTEPSQNAWASVDALYRHLQLVGDEDTTSTAASNIVQIQPPSPRMNTRRKVVMSGKSVSTEIKEMKGRRYFF